MFSAWAHETTHWERGGEGSQNNNKIFCGEDSNYIYTYKKVRGGGLFNFIEEHENLKSKNSLILFYNVHLLYN